VEGFIGADVFAPYLITLNFPEAKLEIELPRSLLSRRAHSVHLGTGTEFILTM
jgi:hypothetical protein